MRVGTILNAANPLATALACLRPLSVSSRPTSLPLPPNGSVLAWRIASSTYLYSLVFLATFFRLVPIIARSDPVPAPHFKYLISIVSDFPLGHGMKRSKSTPLWLRPARRGHAAPCAACDRKWHAPRASTNRCRSSCPSWHGRVYATPESPEPSREKP